MTFDVIQAIVEDELIKVHSVIVRRGIDEQAVGAKIITEAMASVATQAANEAFRELRDNILQKESTARQMASSREMKGYADACKEIVEEIDRLKLPVDPRGRPLPPRSLPLPATSK